jgi:hypothetical protein
VQTSINTSIGPGTEFLYGKRADVRLGFGCASLMQLPSRRRRQELLGEALEQGIRHFDLARMYGLGATEAELGRFARGRRGEIGIATKFGIEPPSPLLARAQAPARLAMAKLPALKRTLKRAAGARGGGSANREPRRYDGAGARRSLETSLRALGTDYVDCFFVHDPGPGDRVALNDVCAACEELVAAGKVRAWGISGEPDPCIGLAAAAEPALLQVRDEIFAPVTLLPDGRPAIGFGIIASPLARIEAHLSGDPAARRRWSEATGCDVGDRGALAALLLREALDRNRSGGVVLATTKPFRLRPVVAAAMAAGEDGDAAAAAFRDCVAQDFRIVPTLHG